MITATIKTTQAYLAKILDEGFGTEVHFLSDLNGLGNGQKSY